MELLQAARTQVQIWTAYSQLNTADNAERQRAIGSLADVGPAALTCLRYASGPLRPPRMQYGAAIALHRLGDREGLTVLCNALRWHLPARPEVQGELEAAFVAIGLPDAVTALIDLFPLLPARDAQTMGCLCNIWGTLRDPRCLDILTGLAWQLPELVLSTVPSFGHMAIGHLESMTREPDAGRRLLAVGVLRQLPFGRSLDVLRPLLCDPDPTVRDAIPQAMAGIDPIAATGGVARALRVGYSSRQAVELLGRHSPRVGELLLELIARWDPRHPDPTHDTAEAVIAAIPLLASTPANADLVPTLCALLSRQPDAAITAAIARLLNARLRPHDEQVPLVREALSARLAHPDREVRQEVGQALDKIGDPLGRTMNQCLDDCWPQGNLLTRLQTVLRGGPDAGQAATQAMQQVSQWFNRLSREAADRLAVGGPLPGSPFGPEYDARLPDVLRQVLRNGLDVVRRETSPTAIEEALALSVAALRALERLAPPAALCAYDELIAALFLVKYQVKYQVTNQGRAVNETAWPLTDPEQNEIGELVRAAAASLLLSCYGPDSYGLFLSALHAPQPEVHRTAIYALSRLGDPRALPYLQAIAARTDALNAGAAQEAISTIRRHNPHVMTLLRASQPGDAKPDTLLRPANGNNINMTPDLLLRPTDAGPLSDRPTDQPANPGLAYDPSG
jgi:HEAT repeat protein